MFPGSQHSGRQQVQLPKPSCDRAGEPSLQRIDNAWLRKEPDVGQDLSSAGIGPDRLEISLPTQRVATFPASGWRGPPVMQSSKSSQQRLSQTPSLLLRPQTDPKDPSTMSPLLEQTAFPPLDEKLMSGPLKPSLPSALRWWCPAKWTGSGGRAQLVTGIVLTLVTPCNKKNKCSWHLPEYPDSGWGVGGLCFALTGRCRCLQCNACFGYLMPSSQVRLLHRNPVAQVEHVVDVNTDLYGRQNCACTPFCLAPRLLPFGAFPIRDGNDHSSCSCTRLQALAPTAALIPQHPHVPFAGNHKDYNALANPGIHAQLPLHGPSIFATQPDIRVGLALGCLRATTGDQDHSS